MRTSGFRLFAIMSMLALTFGGQLCMLVECGAKSAGATTSRAAHACCATASTAGAAKSAPASHDCAKPCCMAAATSPVPELALPDLLDTHEIAATLAAYEMAPLAVTQWPFERRAPRHRHASPPLLAAGLRAPPC